MQRKIWIVLGAVALVASACNTGLLAGDKHPPADIAHAAEEFDKHRQAKPVTDGMFAPPVSYPAGDGPQSVAVGDFDQDGRQDLVTANFNSHDVTVLLGHGDGTFADGVGYFAFEALSVAVGDFNRDGNQDLVTTGLVCEVTVLLGHGDGTFANGVTYPAGCVSLSVAVGDFNQDGTDDLVTANNGEDNVTVLLGHGDGSFAAPVRYTVGDWPLSVAVGDFDQDGRADLVITIIVGDMVSVLLGHGDGTFADGVSHAMGDEPWSVAVGDFNQDGTEDLVTANDAEDNVTVLLGRGNGTFASGVSNTVGDSPVSVAVGDFDQDGRQDLVTANWRSDDVTVLLGHGNGTFASGVSIAVGDSPQSVAVGDFNQDGQLDFVTANAVSDDVSVLINQGGPLPISLDIKPDGFPNSISPHSRGVVPVAILGSDTFDMADIDVSTLRFGPGGAPIAHRHAHFEDANLDGTMDLLLHFRTQDTGIVCGDGSATLTGETLDGHPIEGTDSIQTVGCRETRRPAIWMKDLEREGKPRSDGPVNIERK